MKKNIIVYLHSDKDSMWEDGEEAGLEKHALENFKYAFI
jgi:hypothetical protein